MNLRYFFPALGALIRFFYQYVIQLSCLGWNAAVSGLKEARGDSRPYGQWPTYMLDEIIEQLEREERNDESERILRALVKERRARSMEGSL